MNIPSFPSFLGALGSPAPAVMVSEQDALPGRQEPTFPVRERNAVLGSALLAEPGEHERVIHLAMGCFWGAERIFWQLPGVTATAVGYLGGYTPHPTYREVCTGRTGHAEAVRIVHDTRQVDTETILATFFENHDPTTANRQGNDHGTQYRSGIWCSDAEQYRLALASRTAFDRVLAEAGHGPCTTEVRVLDERAAQEIGEDAGSGQVGRPGTGGPFWPAEDEHQQYLHANPGGYCNHGPNGLSCQVGVADMPRD